MLRKLVIPLCLAAVLSGCADEPRVRRTRPDIILHSEIQTISARVPRNATLDSLLRAHDLSTDLVMAAVSAAKNVFNPRDLRADRPYKLVRSIDGALREFYYEIDADRLLRIVNPNVDRPAMLEASVLPIEKETSVEAVSATIDASHPSLISAVSSSGETIQLALALADVFGGTIDFDSDLQPGDNFEAVFEKATREGEFAGYGAILAARFVADGKEHQAFRWTDPATGKSDYYDEDGRSLKRFFLKSPLKFEVRVTSGFSRRRFHPVHRSFRPHLGVDYGAPYGSPVVSVASGVVLSAGWAGGGGKQVRIRHSSGYESYYLHLSSFGIWRSRRRARVPGAGDRTRWGDRHGHRPSPGLPTAPQRRLREPTRRTREAASGRADRGREPADFPAVARRRHPAHDHFTRRAPRNRPDAIKAITQ